MNEDRPRLADEMIGIRKSDAALTIRDLLLTFDPQERVDILAEIEMCRACGWIGEGARRCQCENDE